MSHALAPYAFLLYSDDVSALTVDLEEGLRAKMSAGLLILKKASGPKHHLNKREMWS